MCVRISRLVAIFLVLVAHGSAAGQSPAPAKEPLGVILKRQHEARERFNSELKATRSEERKAAVDRYLAETKKNTENALLLVQSSPSNPQVVEALKFVIMVSGRGPGDQSYRAMELLRGHERDPGMGEICGRIFHFGHFPVAESLIRAVLERHPNRLDRGQACHQLAMYKLLQAEMVRRIRDKPSMIDEYVHERHKTATAQLVNQADPDDLERQAAALLERVVAEFQDVPHWYDKRPLGAIAQGELTALRHLKVGMIVPEIVGRDHQNKLFSMAEYRGKVVVLTFSGNWCGPCVGMYPEERDLAARQASRPFALLSVNTDASQETLRQSVERGEITWRCWWDGGVTGPITTQWGIHMFPSIFVLDRNGVIRFKDVRGKDLDRAVTSLLNEPAPKSSRR